MNSKQILVWLLLNRKIYRNLFPINWYSTDSLIKLLILLYKFITLWPWYLELIKYQFFQQILMNTCDVIGTVLGDKRGGKHYKF